MMLKLQLYHKMNAKNESIFLTVIPF